jgi:hypothetical protein
MSGNEKIVCFMTGKACSKDIKEDEDKVFVAMPFKNPYFDYYKFGIKEYFSSIRKKCKNITEAHFLGGEYVICKICEEIRKSSLIIADLTERNPNVYYEIGIAHALSKKTIIIYNSNLAKKEKVEKRLKFLSVRSDIRSYSKIRDLKSIFSFESAKFVIPSVSGKERFKSYSIICILPKKKSESKQITYSEIYKFGVRKGIKDLHFPGDDLIELSCKDIHDIIEDAMVASSEKFTNIIHNISRARYCIIDISEKNNTEVFYWLGFIHGLRVNNYVELQKDLTCLYLTNKDFAGLPFDVIAARIIKYNDIADLHLKVKLEIENIEVARIDDANKQKFNFWKNFQLLKTKFIIGAVDCLLPEEDGKKTRSRTSIQDFTAFNRIIYQILFIEERIPFHYKLDMLELIDYIKNGDKELICQEFDEEKLERIFSVDKKYHYDDYIIIGSSCINPAAEQLMRKLYPDKERFEFRTLHKYKSRSRFWKYLESDDSDVKNTGIFYINDKEEQHVGNPEENGEGNVIRDAALLIICSGRYVDENIKGDIILLSGFHKYGTFELSRILSRVNIETRNQEETKRIKKYKEIKFINEKDDFLKIENFFFKINEIKHEKESKNEKYCIEAVFNFSFMEDDGNNKKSSESCSCKKIANEKILKEVELKKFTSFNPEDGKEEKYFLKNGILEKTPTDLAESVIE